MDLSDIKIIVGKSLFDVMVTVLYNYIMDVDSITGIEALPDYVVFNENESDNYNAKKMGFKNFLWWYSEEDDGDYGHLGVGFISFQNKLYKLEYSYRSDC